MDEYTVNRIKQVFRKHQEDFPRFEEQVRRWQAEEDLTEEQTQEVACPVEQMKKIR